MEKKDINGIRTELIVQAIDKEIYCEKLNADKKRKEQLYKIIYGTLEKISINNLAIAMAEEGIKLFDTAD